jgi:hypothetical protein
MSEELPGWIMFVPEGEEDNKRLTDLMRQVRLTYQMVALTGLRNPEACFDPTDYFGYCLPMAVPATPDTPDEYHTALMFGLVHNKDRHVLVGDGVENAHTVDRKTIRAISLRMMGFKIEEFIKGVAGESTRIPTYRAWAGMKGWQGGYIQNHPQPAVVRTIVSYLLKPSGPTDEEANNAATDIINKFRGVSSNGKE